MTTRANPFSYFQQEILEKVIQPKIAKIVAEHDDITSRSSLLNIFNNEPWISATGATSSVIDPRLRRYSITLRKSFGAKPGVRLPGRR